MKLNDIAFYMFGLAVVIVMCTALVEHKGKIEAQRYSEKLAFDLRQCEAQIDAKR